MDVDGDGGAAGLFLGDLVDLDGELESVDLADLALTALVRTADDLNLVLLADGQRAHLVLLSQGGREGSRHDDASDGGGSSEVSLAGLAARAGDVYERLLVSCGIFKEGGVGG